MLSICRRILWVIVGLALLPASLAGAAPLPAWVPPLPRALTRATFSLILSRPQTGEILLAKKPNALMAPASSVKLLTALTALKYLDGAHPYTTALYLKPVFLPKDLGTNANVQDLILKMGGDPSFTKADLLKLLKSLKRLPKKTILRNVIIDNTYFAPPYFPLGAAHEDASWGYAAPVSATIIDENTLKVNFNTRESPGKRFTLNALQRPFFHIDDRVKLVSPSVAMSECAIDIHATQNNDLTLTGCWSSTPETGGLNFAIRYPSAYLQQLVQVYLNEAKIPIIGKIQVGRLKGRASLIAKHSSPSLQILVTRMLKDSNNIIANSLTKKLGRVLRARGTFQAGAKEITNYVSREFGVQEDALMLFDGSGGRYDLVSAEALLKLVNGVYQRPKLRKILQGALPVLGKDGTLAYRAAAYPEIHQQVWAKTGSMKHVSSLTGYIRTRSHQFLSFVMISNNVFDAKDAKDYEDALLQAIWRHY